MLSPVHQPVFTESRFEACPGVVSGHQAINIDGSSTDAYYWRGIALLRTQNLEQAKKHFQEALRLNPDHSKSQVAFKRVRNIERCMAAGKEAMDVRGANCANLHLKIACAGATCRQ